MTYLRTFLLFMASLWMRLPVIVQRVFSVLAVWAQIKLKCNQVRNAILEIERTPKALLSGKNVVCRFLFDTIAGLLLMAFLLQDGVTGEIAKYLMTWAEIVALLPRLAFFLQINQGDERMIMWEHRCHHVGDELSLLIKWLMGVPAGLKLNSQLDQLLGSFFLYHIYLWKGYLIILQPIFAQLLWYGALSGCWGISIQLSLMSDLLSMLTLHIYCFYAYAARLYSLQTHTLASLWRLFRGKKWNPLRHRVDSTSYDVDQLFIGTLLFTIILFLLPTTGVFYLAFTALRLVVITVNGALGWLVSYMNTLPVYSLVARGLHLAEMAGDIRLTTLPRPKKRPLCLSLQVIQRPWSEVYHLYKEQDGHVSHSQAVHTWGEFVRNLITGKLVYPWSSIKNGS